MGALANVNQFGVCELREDELMEVDGGGLARSLTSGFVGASFAAASGGNPFVGFAGYTISECLFESIENADSDSNVDEDTISHAKSITPGI